MIIELGKLESGRVLRVKSDKRQWMIQVRRTVEGVVTWESFAYFSNLTKLYQALVEEEIRLSDATGFKSILSAISAISDSLNSNAVVVRVEASE